MTPRFVGKYVGVVVDNADPRALSRIKARVPEVFEDETTGWALPTELSGPGVGLAAVPPVGSLVFVEWPAGDIARVPIWSGGPRPDGDGVPGAGPDAIVLVTPGGHTVTLDDTSGRAAVRVEAASGAKVTLDADGVAIEFGSQRVELTRAKTSFNGGALEIM